MLKWWLFGGAMVISIAWTWYRGDKLIKARERLLKETTRIENIPDKDVYELTYHGGIPKMPHSQKINIALIDEYVMFFNKKGEKEKVYFASCHKIEKIITRHDPDLKGKSIVLWGPLVGLFLKVKFRYYIVVEYNDSNNNANNILLECEAEKHKALYAALNNRFKNFRRELKLTAKLG
jgi:hypothetical protein